jgi:hypothetical protein
MRHAKQFAPERRFKIPIICIVPGQGFALKAAESSGCLAPHDRRFKQSAQPYFNGNRVCDMIFKKCAGSETRHCGDGFLRLWGRLRNRRDVWSVRRDADKRLRPWMADEARGQ